MRRSGSRASRCSSSQLQRCGPTARSHASLGSRRPKAGADRGLPRHTADGAGKPARRGCRARPASDFDRRNDEGANWHPIMSRRLRYQVAVSLDGFIAGPNGEHDWIVMDPAIDFAALFREFDTAVMGRKTYEVLAAQGGHGAMPGLEVIVFSRTLRPAAYPGVRIVNDDPREVVAALKAKPGRDIWLYGGGDCFRSLLNAGLVDTVELAVVPVAGVTCTSPPPLHCRRGNCPRELIAHTGNAVLPKSNRALFLDYPCDLNRRHESRVRLGRASWDGQTA